MACILVQRHEAEGVMEFHLCFVSFNNTPVPLFFRADTSDGLLLSRFLLRNHCRVGTFIRTDFLFLRCCAAHSICLIQTRLMLTRPCTFVARLKPLHPSHFGNMDLSITEIRVLCTTQIVVVDLTLHVFSILQKKKSHLFSGQIVSVTKKKNVFSTKKPYFILFSSWAGVVETFRTHSFFYCENISPTLPSNFRTEKTNSARSKTFYICQAVQTFVLLFLNLSSNFLELKMRMCWLFS